MNKHDIIEVLLDCADALRDHAHLTLVDRAEEAANVLEHINVNWRRDEATGD